SIALWGRGNEVSLGVGQVGLREQVFENLCAYRIHRNRNGHGLVSVGILKVESARALRIGRHIRDACDAGAPTEAFVIQEEERAILQYRSAQCSAKLVQVQP